MNRRGFLGGIFAVAAGVCVGGVKVIATVVPPLRRIEAIDRLFISSKFIDMLSKELIFSRYASTGVLPKSGSKTIRWKTYK